MSNRPRVAMVVREAHRPHFFPPDTWAELQDLVDVTVADPASVADVDRFVDLLRNARVVISGWGCPPLGNKVLDAAADLELLANTGGSVKAFVTAESWRRGVRVSQAGEAMAYPVAEAAFTMTLSMLRQFHHSDHALRTYQPWHVARGDDLRQEELPACPIGVVGASRMGRAYIELIKKFDTSVKVFDPYLTDPEALGVSSVSLDELMRTSRVVSIHAPATPETRQLVGERELSLLPDGAALVNTARSWVVDMAALYTEVASGRIDAALDVYDTEPLPDDDAWRSLPNVMLTPHSVGATIQSRRRAGRIVLAEIWRQLNGEPLQHEVTAEMLGIKG